MGELGLEIWERVLLGEGGVGAALSARIVSALARARQQPLEPALADTVRRAVLSTVHVSPARAHTHTRAHTHAHTHAVVSQVGAFRSRAPLARYQALVLEPYLAAAGAQHAQHAQHLLHQTSVSNYMQQVLEGTSSTAPRARLSDTPTPYPLTHPITSESFSLYPLPKYFDLEFNASHLCSRVLFFYI